MMLGTLSLSNRRFNGTANPGADRHAIGLSQWAHGFDRLRRKANGDVSCDCSGITTARPARRGLTVRGVVVMLECFRVV